MSLIEKLEQRKFQKVQLFGEDVIVKKMSSKERGQFLEIWKEEDEEVKAEAITSRILDPETREPIGGPELLLEIASDDDAVLMIKLVMGESGLISKTGGSEDPLPDSSKIQSD